jgi:hypothetical protein
MMVPFAAGLLDMAAAQVRPGEIMGEGRGEGRGEGGEGGMGGGNVMMVPSPRGSSIWQQHRQCPKRRGRGERGREGMGGGKVMLVPSPRGSPPHR